MRKNSLLSAILTLGLAVVTILLVTLTFVPGAAPVLADNADDSSAALEDEVVTSAVDLDASLSRTLIGPKTFLQNPLTLTVNYTASTSITQSTWVSLTSGCFPEVFDLTASDLVIRFHYNANGMDDSVGAASHAFANFGVKQVYDPVSAYAWYNAVSPCDTRWPGPHKGMWFATDFNTAQGGLHDGSATNFDLDDKLLLQKAPNKDESAYNLLRTLTTPLTFLKVVFPDPYENRFFWFDRGPASPAWPAGSTNTGGQYDVILRYHARTTSPTGLQLDGMLKINGFVQKFFTETVTAPHYVGPAGMRAPVAAADSAGHHPALTAMYVFYNMSGTATPSNVPQRAYFSDIKVTGVRVRP